MAYSIDFLSRNLTAKMSTTTELTRRTDVCQVPRTTPSVRALNGSLVQIPFMLPILNTDEERFAATHDIFRHDSLSIYGQEIVEKSSDQARAEACWRNLTREQSPLTTAFASLVGLKLFLQETLLFVIKTSIEELTDNILFGGNTLTAASTAANAGNPSDKLTITNCNDFIKVEYERVINLSVINSNSLISNVTMKLTLAFRLINQLPSRPRWLNQIIANNLAINRNQALQITVTEAALSFANQADHDLINQCLTIPARRRFLCC